MSIIASTVVNFGAGIGSSSDLVVMEFDQVLNVDAAGDAKSQFSPGNIIWFGIHHAPTLRIDRVAATSGQVVSQGIVTREMIQQLLWETLTDSHELDRIPSGGLSVAWYGNECSALRRSGGRTVTVAGGTVPALADIRYQSEWLLYKLLTPKVDLADGETWPVTIVAYMEAAL